MSTLAEIQDAISQLSEREQAALAAWLDSRRTLSLNIQDEESLLRSLDEATRDINAGKGVPIEEVRRRVASWAAK
jgi:predicted transcriptional regulator